MIEIKSKGKFDKTIKFLGFLYKRDFLKKLDYYGRIGVEALSTSTPKDTGLTANSWGFSYKTYFNSIKLIWTNSNCTPDGTPIVFLVQYGHYNKGSFVEGKDFINPAIQPVFDFIAEDIWKEVHNA